MELESLVIYFLIMFAASSGGERCLNICSCDQLHTVNCNSKGLKVVPPRIPSHVQNLYADRNKITELPPRMLINAVSLQKLTISRNRITSLRLDNFQNTPWLRYLDLSHNNISLVPPKAFFGLSSLRILKLDSNVIIRVSPLAFKYLRSLRKLFLSDNRIETLPEALFTSLDQLQILALDGNQISAISHGIFRSLPLLQELNLGRNRIKHVAAGSFGGLQSLRTLHLHDNGIENLDENLRKPNVSCDAKGVGNSSSSEIVRPRSGQRGAFENLRELQTLDLSNNLLKEIRPASFFGLRLLQTLDLAGNLWRCDCAFKWSMKAIRKSNHRKSLTFGKVACQDPTTALQLEFRDTGQLLTNTLAIRRENREESEKEMNMRTDKVTFPPEVNSSEMIRSVRRPSNDLMTERSNTNPTTQSEYEAPTIRSQISTLEIVSIATTTSPGFNQRVTSVGGGVNQDESNKRDFRAGKSSMRDRDNTNTVPDVTSRTSNGDRFRIGGDTVAVRKPAKRRSEAWLMPTAIALSIIAVFACTTVIVQFMAKGRKSKRCCVKGSKSHNTSIRSVTSYPLLYDSHHFVTRPLPQAPSQQSQFSTNEEIRWTNGSAYGLGSNHSSFVSLQSHSVFESVNENRQLSQPVQRAINETNERPRFDEVIPAQSRNVYSYVETIVPTRMLDQRPPMAPPTMNRLHPGDYTQRKNLELRKKLEERRRRRKMVLEMAKPPENARTSTSVSRCNVAGQNINPPPVPRRNESSKIRCQELRQRNFLRNHEGNVPEYCEISSLIPKHSTQYAEQLLYTKYREGIAHYPPVTFSATRAECGILEGVSPRPRMAIHRPLGQSLSQPTPRWCNRQIEPPRTIFESEQSLHSLNYGTRSPNPRRMYTKAENTRHDRMFCEKMQRATGLNLSAISAESSRNSLLLEDDTSDQDSCFNHAEDDFVISFPQVTMRKSCPGGLFGSDQHILDSLRQQDLGIYKPRHHTAPTGVDDLTLPLSEISTDDDELCDVFPEESENTPSCRSTGSLSNKQAKTTDLKEDDSFVYTMAREAPTEAIPKIVINDGQDEQYDTLDEIRTSDARKHLNSDVLHHEDDTSHHYHHLQFSYSGFSGGDNKSAQGEEKTTYSLNCPQHSRPPHRSWKNFQKNLKRKRRERHYYSIDTGAILETYDNMSENSNSKITRPGLKNQESPEKKRERDREAQPSSPSPKEVTYASRESEIYCNAIRNAQKVNEELSQRKECTESGDTISIPDGDGLNSEEGGHLAENCAGGTQELPQSVEELLRECCSNSGELSTKTRQISREYCSIKMDENKNPVVKIRLVKNCELNESNGNF